MPMKVVFYTDKIIAASDIPAEKIVTAAAVAYTNDVKKLMRDSPASGRVYSRGRTKHRASAPGEPPAPDTGDLLRSIRFQIRKTATGWIAETGSTLKKSLYLEFGAARVPKRAQARGTPKRPFMPEWILFPRPAWGPALKALRRRMPEIIRNLRRR